RQARTSRRKMMLQLSTLFVNLALLAPQRPGDSGLPDGWWKIPALAILGIFLLVFLFVFIRYANLYVQSVLAKAGVGLFDMFAMSLRKVNPAQIVKARIMLVQARIPDVDRRDLEAHLLAGGRVERVVVALIAADRAGIPLTFRTAASIDLAGRDV